ILRDFGYVIPLVVAAAVVARRCPGLRNAKVCVTYGGLLALAWIAIMLPWGLNREYYLLPVALGTAIIVGCSLSLICSDLRRGRVILTAACALAVALVLLTIPNGYSTARQQLTVDETNAKLLRWLADRAPPNGRIVADFADDSEYISEIGLQLQLLY